MHGESGLAGDVTERYMQHLITQYRNKECQHCGSKEHPCHLSPSPGEVYLQDSSTTEVGLQKPN